MYINFENKNKTQLLYVQMTLTPDLVHEELTLDQYDVMQLVKDGVTPTDDSFKYSLSTGIPDVGSTVHTVLC